MYVRIGRCRHRMQGDLVIQEKLDGINVQLYKKDTWIFATRSNIYTPRTFPHAIELPADFEVRYEKLKDAVGARELHIFGELVERGYIDRGFFIFDIVIVREDEAVLLPARALDTFASELGLRLVPFVDYARTFEALEPFWSHLGGRMAEGVVVKEARLIVGQNLEDVLLKRKTCKYKFHQQKATPLFEEVAGWEGS